MKKKFLSIAAIAAVGILGLSACSGGQASTDAPTQSAKADVKLDGSPTFDRMTKTGKVTIGVKEDQPGLGYLDAVSGERSGFDIEIAKWAAADLGFAADKIEFKAIPSANREDALSRGDIDLYVGTYSITDKRKAMIDFAGPYFVTGQGLLVKKSDDSIKSKDDLAGKTVCSATGSTPIQNIKDNYPNTKTVEFKTYTECVDAMKNGQADAVTTDEAILLGYASEDPDNLKVVGEPFTTEKYGIGLPKGDKVLRDELNSMLTDGHDEWQKIYDATLGKSGTKADQPKVEAY